MTKSKIRQPTALGAYVFAGGFSVGLEQAGFEILGHLEETSYGVATAKTNLPHIPVHVGMKNWPISNLKKKARIDLVYGNPPCAAWSQAGNVVFGADWRDDPRVDCSRRHFNLLLELRPRVFVWESVVRAFTAGRELVDQFTSLARTEGYSVTYLLHNAKYLGSPQNRARFFFVAHEKNFDPLMSTWRETSVKSVIGREPRLVQSDHDLSDDHKLLIPSVSQGSSLRTAWEAVNPKRLRKLNSNGKVIGRPSFAVGRGRWNECGHTVAGYPMIHPLVDRCMTTREMALICGFPKNFEFIATNGPAKAKLISRGVCPPVAKWLGKIILLAGKKRLKISFTQLVDLRKPGISTEIIAVKSRTPPITTSKKRKNLGEDMSKKKRLGSGEFIRFLLITGQYSSDQIVKMVHEKYPSSKATTKDVSWNMRKLRLAGETCQPTAKKSLPSHVDSSRTYDTTSLTRGSSTGLTVHRDYGAHFFRWGFVGRFVDQDETTILDVGCGSDVPLVGVLSKPRPHVPKKYVGVDFRKPPKKTIRRSWARIEWEFDFIKRNRELGKFDLVICFEVLEHMRKPAGEKLLVGLRECVNSEGTVLLSTPVYNGKAAANHLHEWTVDELQVAVSEFGLRVVKRFGTFASYYPLKKVATTEEMALLDRLREYYSNEVMACFLAPLYPDQSRNNVWVLKKNKSRSTKKSRQRNQ